MWNQIAVHAQKGVKCPLMSSNSETLCATMTKFLTLDFLVVSYENIIYRLQIPALVPEIFTEFEKNV